MPCGREAVAFIAHSIPNVSVERCRSKSAPPACPPIADPCDQNGADEIRCELAQTSILYQKSQRDVQELTNKIENMRIEWRSQQEHLGKLHQEYTKLQHTLGQHSVYCATLGATMGSLLWKVSRMEGTVENMLEGSRMSDLITIMDNSLKAFLEVFGCNIPDSCSNEYQFVLSWCGVLTNVSACPDGRYFLSTKMEGRRLINHLINALPKFSSRNGLLLQRMILMIIYNLAINVNGMDLLQHNPKLTTIISKIICDNATESEIQDLILKLMFSLTQSINSIQYFEHIKETFPMYLIEQIANDSNSQFQEAAKEIQTNLDKFEKNMETQIHVINAENEMKKRGVCPKKNKTNGAEETKKRYHCKHQCKSKCK